ncbi:MAG: hypothetical protein KBT04_06875 [Bacteroidales bacterium]|nr:hypothetical protein [Candidatus Colimorpha onthohippi]
MLSNMGLLKGQLLVSDDFYDQWNRISESYIADSVKEFSNYPSAALGWAMYLGMAVAKYWDLDWDFYSKIPNLYEFIRDKRGYDYLDEEVRDTVLGLKNEDFHMMEQLVQTCSEYTLSLIRHQHVEPRTAMAFYTYSSSVKVLFVVGASLQMRRMGYDLSPLS